MYRALKNTQLEIADTLMKFADEIAANTNTNASASSSAPSNTNNQFVEAIDALNKKHDAQFSLLVAAIDRLNSTFQKHLTVTASASQHTVNTSLTIPSLNPVANPVDMLSSVKTVQVSLPQPAVEEEVEVEEEEIEEIEVEEEVEVEVEEEVVEVEEEVEVEVIEEAEEEVVEEEEAEVEVEEWTYKGMAFFKDSNNIVYSNDNGDVGEPIGKYDPLKKVLKRL